jgi:L-lactate dehydrogenase complex protein LldF
LERWSVGAAKRTLASPRRYRAAGRWARRMLRVLPRALVSSRFNVWARQRELPDPPGESFGEWYRRTRG